LLGIAIQLIAISQYKTIYSLFLNQMRVPAKLVVQGLDKTFFDTFPCFKDIPKNQDLLLISPNHRRTFQKTIKQKFQYEIKIELSYMFLIYISSQRNRRLDPEMRHLSTIPNPISKHPTPKQYTKEINPQPPTKALNLVEESKLQRRKEILSEDCSNNAFSTSHTKRPRKRCR
jgi:hypothetical protein